MSCQQLCPVSPVISDVSGSERDVNEPPSIEEHRNEGLHLINITAVPFPVTALVTPRIDVTGRNSLKHVRMVSERSQTNQHYTTPSVAGASNIAIVPSAQVVPLNKIPAEVKDAPVAVIASAQQSSSTAVDESIVPTTETASSLKLAGKASGLKVRHNDRCRFCQKEFHKVKLEEVTEGEAKAEEPDPGAASIGFPMKPLKININMLQTELSKEFVNRLLKDEDVTNSQVQILKITLIPITVPGRYRLTLFDGLRRCPVITLLSKSLNWTITKKHLKIYDVIEINKYLVYNNGGQKFFIIMDFVNKS